MKVWPEKWCHSVQHFHEQLMTCIYHVAHWNKARLFCGGSKKFSSSKKKMSTKRYINDKRNFYLSISQGFDKIFIQSCIRFWSEHKITVKMASDPRSVLPFNDWSAMGLQLQYIRSISQSWSVLVIKKNTHILIFQAKLLWSFCHAIGHLFSEDLSNISEMGLLESPIGHLGSNWMKDFNKGIHIFFLP